MTCSVLSKALLAGWLLSAAVVGATTEELRDPTRPLGLVREKKTAVKKLQLHSILISDSRRTAIINGKSVGENGSVDGAKVLRILPGKVVVRHNGVEKSLVLHASVKKQS